MKYLKIILAIIVVIVLIFFGNGLLNASFEYENEVSVNKSPAEVWVVMSDPTKMPDWLPGFEKMEPVSGMQGTVGAVSKIYFIENGEEIVMEETITDLQPGEFISMTFTSDFMNMEYESRLIENEGGTSIKTKSKSMGNGLFARSILSFMKGAMHDQEDENLNNLKKVIEGK